MPSFVACLCYNFIEIHSAWIVNVCLTRVMLHICVSRAPFVGRPTIISRRNRGHHSPGAKIGDLIVE